MPDENQVPGHSRFVGECPFCGSSDPYIGDASIDRDSVGFVLTCCDAFVVASFLAVILTNPFKSTK